MKKSVRKTLYLVATVGIVLGVWYVYAFMKGNTESHSELGKHFMQNITKLTRGVEYDVVIFQGVNVAQVKNSFPSGVEVVEYNPKDDMVKVRERMKDKTFLLMWEIGEDYRLPDMTRKYRLFFSNHKKTLYAPFEQEVPKRFAWQNNTGINVQYYLFEKPQPLDFSAIQKGGQESKNEPMKAKKNEDKQKVADKKMDNAKYNTKSSNNKLKAPTSEVRLGGVEVKKVDDSKVNKGQKELDIKLKEIQNGKLEDEKTADSFKVNM